MATGLEAVGAAATLISIVGFSAQVFDGCVKGFVLLSTAQNLGRDADILRSMLDWEQFRLEQWAEKAGLQDPSKADILMDWKLITTTLQHIQNLTNDTEVLKEKYNLVLLDRAPHLSKMVEGDESEKFSTSRFKRLFSPSDKHCSTAAGKVIQSKNSVSKKLWWAAVDRDSMQQLIHDIAYFVQRLHDLLNLSMQIQMQKSIDSLLYEATQRYSDVPDLEYLRGLANWARYDPPGHERSKGEDLAEEIEKKFRNRLFYSIRKGETKEVEFLLDRGVGVQVNDNVGWPPLVRASEYGQLAIVKFLLARGADPLIGTIGDRLPLHFAAEEGHAAVVELLLQQSSIYLNKKDFTGQTALFKAAKQNQLKVVALLLQQKGIEPDCVSKDGFTPLITSVFGRHINITKLLLERPDVNPNLAETSYQQTPLWLAATAGVDMLQLFLARKDIQVDGRSRWLETPLFQAIQRGRLPQAKLLLDTKADPNVPNSQEHTPLYWTADNGKEEPMELLLAQPTIAVDLPDKLAQTPLLRAASNGHVKCVRLLLAKDANVQFTDKETKTALHLAAANGHKVIAKVLLKHKADINAQDKTGNTPLALASVGNHDAVVRLLLENGADAELPDEDEETPFEKARDKHMDQIVEIFREVLKLPEASTIALD